MRYGGANTIPASTSDLESTLRKRKRDVHDTFRPNLPRPRQDPSSEIISQSAQHLNRTTTVPTTTQTNNKYFLPQPKSTRSAYLNSYNRDTRVKQNNTVASLVYGENKFESEKTSRTQTNNKYDLPPPTSIRGADLRDNYNPRGTHVNNNNTASFVCDENKFHPQKMYDETMQCSRPPQKRNRSELLSLFGGRNRVVPRDNIQGRGVSSDTLVSLQKNSSTFRDSNVPHGTMLHTEGNSHTNTKSSNIFCQALDISLGDEDDFSDTSFQSPYEPKTNCIPNTTFRLSCLPWESSKSQISSSNPLENEVLTSCIPSRSSGLNGLPWQSDEYQLSGTRLNCPPPWQSNQSHVSSSNLLNNEHVGSMNNDFLLDDDDDYINEVTRFDISVERPSRSSLVSGSNVGNVLDSQYVGTENGTVLLNYDEDDGGNDELTMFGPSVERPSRSLVSGRNMGNILDSQYVRSGDNTVLLDYNDGDDELTMFGASDERPSRSSLVSGRNMGNILDSQYVGSENGTVLLDYNDGDNNDLTMIGPSVERATSVERPTSVERATSFVFPNSWPSTSTSFVSNRSLSSSRRVHFTSPLMSSVNNNSASSSYQQGSRVSNVDGVMGESFVRPQSFAGGLYFPSNAECCESITPTRQVAIQTKFSSAIDYKGVLKSALREHLNIIIFELAQQYYGILRKADVTSFSDILSDDQKENVKGPSCSHGPGKLRAVKKDGPNKGRHFYTCSGSGTNQCKYFQWADENHTTSSSGNKKISLTSSDSIKVFFKSKGINFYHNCLLERRTQMSRTKFYGKKYSRKGFNMNSEKKSMYIVLKYKDTSSLYSKDDIWIISKSVNFEPRATFVAKSLFYGPSSSGDLEIEPLSGYSPSNWRSGDPVHAIWVCNAGTELSCIQNLDDYVTLQHMPLLPYLLNGSQPTYTSQRHSFSAPVSRSIDRNSLGIAWPVIEEETGKMIALYNLNKDQAAALCSCAKMFVSETEDRMRCLPITLIHGVFGAGKSFLLAVVVLLMVKLFEIADTSDEARTRSITWKILISSTTNVAVDRILLGLLDLGFDQFVRVGSVRKIAKPVLPHSIHNSGTESQELKELQGLLKTELTSSEKAYVRKSIEMHKLGENRKRLASVRVVGVTCAACTFPILERLKFPVLLLDECSQMTEPTSLLPMARFGCRKLVLVGDPKQLNPTIQGSEPAHDSGLEQTLFDRLIKMDLKPIFLRMQYRCHPVISTISNRLFYNDKLLDGVNAEDREPLVDFIPTLCFYNVINGKEECSQDGSYFNSTEAKFVVVLIRSLLESDIEPKQIGVITQYKSQLTAITNSLSADGSTSHKEWAGIQISTVDAFQGGEKDVIILSCVRTKHIGFIDCERRTNVALTRAKRHLCIVGCGKILSSNSLWGKIITLCRDAPEGFQSSESYIKRWNERKAELADNSKSSTGSSSEPKKPRKSRKTDGSKITSKPSNETRTQGAANVSTADVFIPIETRPSSHCNKRTDLVEVEEIFDRDPTFEEISDDNGSSDHKLAEISDTHGDPFETSSNTCVASKIPDDGKAFEISNGGRSTVELFDHGGAFQLSNNGGTFKISPDAVASKLPDNDKAVKISNNCKAFQISDGDDCNEDEQDLRKETAVAEKQTNDFESNFSDYMFDVDSLTDDELCDVYI